MTKSSLSRLCVGLILVVSLIAPAARATSLDTLITTNGTITQGNLTFSRFGTSPATPATTIDVAGVTLAGADGLRFTSLPVGTKFTQSATGGKARELVLDITFIVTVNNPSSTLIHSVTQDVDPTETATGNAIIRHLTGIPSGAPTFTLFSCLAGNGVPPGQTCPTPIDSQLLHTDAPSLYVDRQEQMLLNQNGGAGPGSASVGF